MEKGVGLDQGSTNDGSLPHTLLQEPRDPFPFFLGDALCFFLAGGNWIGGEGQEDGEEGRRRGDGKVAQQPSCIV